MKLYGYIVQWYRDGYIEIEDILLITFTSRILDVMNYECIIIRFPEIRFLFT